MTKAVSIAQSGSNNVTMRNRIINGNMTIDQRNAGALGTYTSGLTYYLDRWRAYGSSSGKFTTQQTPSTTEAGYATRVAAGFLNYLAVTSTAATSLSAGDTYRIEQSIEGYNTADLGFGTASPSQFTISFWVRSSLTGTFGGAVWNADASRSYVFSYTISAANTWEQKFITITADTSGTWNTTTGQGLVVQWSLGAGSTYLATANTWSSGLYTGVTGQVNMIGTSGATFYITGVQLEKGSTATPFEQRLYGTELALCQRYCQKLSDASSLYQRFASGFCQSTTVIDATVPLRVSMRTTPGLTTTGTASNYAVYSGASVVTVGVAIPALNGAGSNADIANVQMSVASGLTSGQGGFLIANNSTSSYLLFTAEL